MQRQTVMLFEGFMLSFLLMTTLVTLYLSYYLELMIYRSIFDGIDYVVLNGITVSVFFAATFNSAKLALTWILANLKTAKQNRLMAFKLRIILILNSLLMSIFIVTGQFSAPYAEKMLAEQKVQIENRFYAQTLNEERRHERVLERRKRDYEMRIAGIRELFQPDLDQAKAGMSYEMDNVRGGVWKGKKYREWEHKYKFSQDKMGKALATALEKYQEGIRLITSAFDLRQQKYALEKQSALAAESVEKYADRYESQNKHVTKVIHLVNKVSGAGTINQHHLMLLVAFLITTIVEFVPLLLGGYLFDRIIEMRSELKTSPSQKA